MRYRASTSTRSPERAGIVALIALGILEASTLEASSWGRIRPLDGGSPEAGLRRCHAYVGAQGSLKCLCAAPGPRLHRAPPCADKPRQGHARGGARSGKARQLGATRR